MKKLFVFISLVPALMLTAGVNLTKNAYLDELGVDAIIQAPSKKEKEWFSKLEITNKAKYSNLTDREKSRYSILRSIFEYDDDYKEGYFYEPKFINDNLHLNFSLFLSNEHSNAVVANACSKLLMQGLMFYQAGNDSRARANIIELLKYYCTDNAPLPLRSEAIRTAIKLRKLDNKHELLISQVTTMNFVNKPTRELFFCGFLFDMFFTTIGDKASLESFLKNAAEIISLEEKYAKEVTDYVLRYDIEEVVNSYFTVKLDRKLPDTTSLLEQLILLSENLEMIVWDKKIGTWKVK